MVSPHKISYLGELFCQEAENRIGKYLEGRISLIYREIKNLQSQLGLSEDYL